MNPFENLKPTAQNDQNNLLAECKGKLLEVVEKSKNLDAIHKKQLYEWCCKNAAISSIAEFQSRR